MIGQTVSHYQIIEKLGEGGMGVVYLAEDTSLERKVALKFLPPRLQDDEIAHRRFVREAKSAAALDHPFICNIYEVAQTDEGQDFIAMEYVEGQTLKERLAEGPLQLRDTLQVGVEIAEALEVAHQQNIVHRDLKPANIILTPQGHPKVMDFGLAKKVVTEDGTEQDITSALTREGSTLGTLPYMSPEQVKAKPVDLRSDIFSFGIVLYEMITGVHPFRRAEPLETTAAILQVEPAPLTQYVEDVPELLQHTITKMLAKNPDDRYQSVHEVRTNLKELSVEVSRPSEVVIPVRRKPSWIPIGLGLVGLILAILLGYWGWNILRQPTPTIEQDRRSIAVLPFDNLSPNPDDEYFSDGITEDITAELAKIGDLRVMGRTSAFRFKGSDQSLSEIAGELGVATLLEGSVRRADGRVRIVAQLIDGTTEEHLWAETYDRELEDIFAIQSDVAEQIAASLEVELSSEEKSQIEKKFTESAEAYNLYLLGRHYRKLETRTSLPKARTYYQQAIELDSEFALAFAGLAECYALLFMYNLQENGLDHSEQASAQALELDPSIALTHIAKGHVAQLRGDVTGAAVEYAWAVALEPQNADAHREYGRLLWQMGRLDDALPELKEAHALDPLDWLPIHNLTYWYIATGEYDEAFKYARKELELYPDGSHPHRNLGRVYSRLGIYGKAEQHLKQALELSPERPPDTLARSYLRSGQLDEAVAVSCRALSVWPNHRRFNLLAASVNLWKGDYAKAVEQYEKSRTSPPRIDRDAVAQHRTGWGFALWKLGHQTEAQRQFSESIRLCEEDLEAGDQTYFPREKIATVHAIRGEKEEAYGWLEGAIEAGWRDYALLLRDPMWADFQGEDRFRQMMAEVRAKVEDMRKRVEEMEKQWEE